MPVEYSTISIVRCERLSRRLDQPRHVLDTEDLRQPARDLRIRRVLEKIAALQCFHEEEADRADMQFHRPRRSFRSRRRYAW